ncbi:MAG: glutamate synthase-related protein, partial [SAR324 cluster bacterium]|nr:glutamate synthase-related protein [SAR324 cluster bacterium]
KSLRGCNFEQFWRWSAQEIPELTKEKALEIWGRKDKKFNASRFEQISTGRFGVEAAAYQDTEFFEIKIGQGAKPGVGGSLPGKKVVELIAKTRGVNEGQTLNSPTVHHDIYSIEDLRQLVTALKVFQPKAKVSVKMGAMDDLDIVAYGVVKAGADFIWIDGFEAGTGSAKDSHKEHCGLPSWPVVHKIHRALIDHGLRGSYVKIGSEKAISREKFHHLTPKKQLQYHWVGPRIVASGGVRSAWEAVKMLLAGADYVGYGDLAQNAVGCIRCYKCDGGNCPAAITTNKEKVMKRFETQKNHQTLQKLVGTLDIGMKQLAYGLNPNLKNIEELVGKSHLLMANPASKLQVRGDFFKNATESANVPRAIKCLSEDQQKVLASPVNVQLRSEFDLWVASIFAQITKENPKITGMADLLEAKRLVTKLPKKLLTKSIQLKVTNQDRLVGTAIVRDFIRLKNWLAIVTGQEPLLKIFAQGYAGSGFGMFATAGMEFYLLGAGGDYLGEANSGAKFFLFPTLGQNGYPISGEGGAGNTVAYGMRSGELHLCERAGTRFGIRLSGGKVFLWANNEQIQNSYNNQQTTPQFLAEYMTQGVVVCCSNPGYNLMAAATGKNTFLLVRIPIGRSPAQQKESLEYRIPANFEVVTPTQELADLILEGHRDYLTQANQQGIDADLTPITDGEDPKETFLLIREKL